MFIGDIEVVPIEFGRFRLDGGAMFGVVPKVLWEKVAPADEANRIRMALRGALIRTSSRTILVDTGIGDKGTEKFREIYCVDYSRYSIAQSLAALKIGFEEVTDVVLTHLHFDHTGGATKLDSAGTVVPAFPNATYYVQKKQYEWALKPSLRDRVSFLRENFVPLMEKGCLKLVEGEHEIFPGVRTLLVNGHTPGQQLVKVSRGGETLLFAGDLVPMAAHIPLPWIMSYDLSPLVTLEEKEKLLPVIASEGWILIYEHDPDIVASRVEGEGTAFRLGEKVIEVQQT
jgi:glyoxylase-like metal-dependent hydrolase (beta-lactamase superfamily II)